MNVIEYVLIVVAILFVFFVISTIIKASRRIPIIASIILVFVISIGILGSVYFNQTVDVAKNISDIVINKELENKVKRIRKNIIIRPGAIEMLSLHLAYPDRISKPTIKNREVGFFLDDIWFNWADGKILKDEERENVNNHINFEFYDYPLKGLPKVETATPEKTKEIEEYYIKRISNRKTINNTFLNTLYDGSSERSMSKNIVTVSVLGYRVRLHRYIIEPLTNATAEIRLMAETNTEVSNYLKNLHTVSGFVWKNIKASASRSYHSYGVAFDTLPKKNRKAVYWAWTRVNNKNWYAVPHEERWYPPLEVIDIFEKYGFIWGGKWRNYDTIHFEYRPELLIYNRLMEDENEAYSLIEEYGLY